MATEIYLDTARLGRMCHGARSAEQDFGWLVGQCGSSLYLERFLSHGYRALPDKLVRRVGGLKCWRGVAGLRQGLGRFVCQPPELPTYFFGQSSASIRFAAECLFTQAKRVLATDLAWPPYLEALRQHAKARDANLIVLPLSKVIRRDGATSSDVVRILREAFHRYDCNGIFVSDITYLGTRMPVRELLAELAATDQRPFVVVDGAQAFHQRPVDLSELNCDLYLAGTQKWLGSYHPLRIAFIGRHDNARTIANLARSSAEAHDADALFQFCRSMELREFASYGETVNISALIAAAGALTQATRHADAGQRSWRTLKQNARSLAEWISNSSWQPVKQDESLSSGILLLTPSERQAATESPRAKQRLLSGGIVASPFPDGTLRLSMPRFDLTLSQQSKILRALEWSARPWMLSKSCQDNAVWESECESVSWTV